MHVSLNSLSIVLSSICWNWSRVGLSSTARVQLELPHALWSRASNSPLLGGLLLHSARINRGESWGSRYEFHRATGFPTDKTLGRSRGCARAHRRPLYTATAVQEQIYTKEPGMASGSSSAREDCFLSPSPFLVLDLGFVIIFEDKWKPVLTYALWGCLVGEKVWIWLL